MIANKHLSKIIMAFMAVAVVLVFLAVIFSEKLTETLGGTGVSMEYESELFNTDEIIDINIQMDADQWEKMLANASAEEYYVCDVVINGKTVKNVGIRPKGNTSLSAIAMDPDTDRYSLKLEFDHFVEDQTCYGLDKLILNNNYADATNMKETVIYDMFQYLGADASLYNYAKVSINGEYWGVYLALEGVEDSFMTRNYGTQSGELYKPESLGMGGGGGAGDSDRSSMPGMDFSNFDFSNIKGNIPNSQNGGSQSQENPGSTPNGDTSGFNPGSMPSGDVSGFNPGSMPSGDTSGFNPGSMPSGDASGFNPGSMPSGDTSGFDPASMPSGDGAGVDFSNIPSREDVGGGNGGFSTGNGGANLNYSDDNLDSYSTIWEGAVTNVTKSDERRVVTALKNISEGIDLEKYLDVDNILKYMAVHTFAVNMDSLSGSMAHNYYLYEYNGQLNMIPWDYNLSFGGMTMGSTGGASDMINDAIDTPFSGTKFFDALLENEEYLNRYHEYLQQLVDEYVNGGRFDTLYEKIRAQIDTLVETDPTAFYSADEYHEAVEMLYKTIKLRAESIDGQLAGTIPSTDNGQRADSSALVDASEINVEIMGQFSMGGFGGGNSFANFGGKIEDGNQENAGGDAVNDGDSSNIDFSKFDGDMSNIDFSNFGGMSFGGSSIPGRTGQSGGQMNTVLALGISLLAMVLALVGLKVYKRRR